MSSIIHILAGLYSNHITKKNTELLPMSYACAIIITTIYMNGNVKLNWYESVKQNFVKGSIYAYVTGMHMGLCVHEDFNRTFVHMNVYW